MNKKIKLRVNKIESYRDQNGILGKKIELVEDLDTIMPPTVGTEEAKMISDLMLQLQTVMPMLQKQSLSTPKMLLYLTEEECDSLNVPLDVNRTYEITFEDHAIKFYLHAEEGEP